jgi:hypothetical protein
MTTTYKTLGQSAPLATTETDLYTVPAVTSTIVSSLIVCNRGATATTFRISNSVGGGATATKDYIYFDVSIAANETFIATVGVTMATTDKLRVFAGNTNLSFAAYGSEIT